MRYVVCGDGISRGSREDHVCVCKDKGSGGEYALVISTDVTDGRVLFGGCDYAFLGEIEGDWKGA